MAACVTSVRAPGFAEIQQYYEIALILLISVLLRALTITSLRDKLLLPVAHVSLQLVPLYASWISSAGELIQILLDMDGTLLDLAFDNYFWQKLVLRPMANSRVSPRQKRRNHSFEI